MSIFKQVWPFWIHFVVAGMLLWALRGDNTYGYYTALRWLVFLFFCFLARVASECNERKIFWILVAVVLIYNPFVRPPFGREIWSIINLLTLIPLALTVPFMSRNVAANS
jgi:hypothetical protein